MSESPRSRPEASGEEREELRLHNAVPGAIDKPLPCLGVFLDEEHGSSTIPGSDDLVPRTLGFRAADQGPIWQRVSDGQPRELNGHGLAPHETRHRRNSLVATADGKAVFEHAGEDTAQFIDVVRRYSLFALGHESVVQGFVYR